MIELALPAAARNILCLGAHADDIEIGCGGTLLKWLAGRPELRIHWVVFTAEGKRASEARASAKGLLPKGALKVVVKQFPGSFMPYQGAKVKAFFETLKTSFQPDVVFTHYREDRHQDHRLLSDLAWNTYRDHLILEYEIPKYDGDLGSPDFFVPLDEALARKKAAHICEHFQTQGNKHWFAEETFLALMRLRGVECASTYAEAFHCRKLRLG
ncbi:MAG: PIG-L deacetylase family protein [Chthoniobacterales bacterium]